MVDHLDILEIMMDINEYDMIVACADEKELNDLYNHEELYYITTKAGITLYSVTCWEDGTFSVFNYKTDNETTHNTLSEALGTIK